MIGEKLGSYTIVEIVGSGSMGTVYRAEDPEGRPVALKFIRSQVLYSMEKRERFLQCLLTATEIRHKSVCPILEVGDDNDDFFVVMPFIQGKTLDQYMDRKPIPWTHAVSIARAVASPLEAVHKAGAAHRGLKPANIWVLSSSEPTVLLSDCCISRFTEIPKRGRVRSCGVGLDFADTLIPLDALAYMSPEQVRGEPVDFRTDIFSFGVILYEMLTGRHPFEARSSLSRISSILEAEAPSVTSHQRTIPSSLDAIIRKALFKNREDRYQSISALADDLNSVRQSSSSSFHQDRKPTGIRNWFSSRFHRK